MPLSLDALTALDAIERRGSFAAAAAELHRVPSAITYQVQKLEQDLDVLLFDRRTHRAKLTPAGREVFGGAWDALAEGRADLVLGAAGDPPAGGGYRTRVLAESVSLFTIAPMH